MAVSLGTRPVWPGSPAVVPVLPGWPATLPPHLCGLLWRVTPLLLLHLLIYRGPGPGQTPQSLAIARTSNI